MPSTDAPVETQDAVLRPRYWWVYWALAVLLVGAVAFAFFWWYRTQNNAGLQRRTSGPPSADLAARSPMYVDAMRLFAAGEYQAAANTFLDALNDARDKNQRAQIAYKVALSTEKAGNYMGAIRQYQMILGDETNYRYVRAYAALRLANMITVPAAQDYLDEIFAWGPYARFRVEGDREATKRNMNEYVSSIYPLPPSELMLGAWYGSQALKGVDKEINTQRAIQKLASADADIPRVENDPNERSSMPEILKRRAALVGVLALLGAKTHEEAVQAFEKALPLDTIAHDGELGFVSYFYASYLERALGEKGWESVRAALRPYYTPTMRTSNSVVSFFAGERKNRQEQKLRLVTLAAADPEFKKYLLSLGWTDADFD